MASYCPMTIADLPAPVAGDRRQDPLEARVGVPGGVPVGAGGGSAVSAEGRAACIGDERWDVLLAALAEHLAAKHDLAPPAWAELRVLHQPWFPAELRSSAPMPWSGRPPRSASTASICRPWTWKRRDRTWQRPPRPGATRAGVHCPRRAAGPARRGRRRLRRRRGGHGTGLRRYPRDP